MTKLQELLARGETRSKELSAFIAEHGDNISAERLREGETIRSDLAEIRSQIDLHKKAEKMGEEAAEFGRFLNDPATSHRVNEPNGRAGVIGSTSAGSVTVRREGKTMRALRQAGPSMFGKDTFAAISEPSYQAAYRKYLCRGEMGLNRLEKRTLSEGYDQQGGYLAPTQWMARMIQRKATPNRIAGRVETVNCTSDSMSMPRVNYSGASDDTAGTIYSTGFRVTGTDENPTSDTQAQVDDSNLFGSTRIAVFTYMIKGIVTNNLVEDAMFDPMAFLDSKFGETAELHKEKMMIVGPGGSDQPRGMLADPLGTDTFLNAPLINSGTAASPYMTPDGLIDMSEDIPDQYENGITYVYRKTTTGKIIRKFKDANGRYLFAQGTQDSGLAPGGVTEINGKPVIHSPFMPSPAASPNYPVICGDLKGMCLVNRVGFSIQVLREVGAMRNQLVLVGRFRFGCQPIEPWRYRVMKVSA